MPKFVYDGLEYSSNGHVVKLTQAEYDALPNTKLADDIIYLIIDSNDDKFEAKNLPYDGSITGLGNTVQDAIDEMNNNMGTLRFGVDGDGNGGYYKADDSFVPFKNLDINQIKEVVLKTSFGAGNTITTKLTKNKLYFVYLLGMNWDSAVSSTNCHAQITGFNNCIVNYLRKETRYGNAASNAGGCQVTTAIISDVVDEASITTYVNWTGIHIIYEIL